MIRRDFSSMTEAHRVEFGALQVAGAAALVQVFLTTPGGEVASFLYSFTAEADGWKSTASSQLARSQRGGHRRAPYLICLTSREGDAEEKRAEVLDGRNSLLAVHAGTRKKSPGRASTSPQFTAPSRQTKIAKVACSEATRAPPNLHRSTTKCVGIPAIARLLP